MKLDLTDYCANFGNSGGDMCELNAKVVGSIYKEEGSIKLKLKNIECGPELPEDRKRYDTEKWDTGVIVLSSLYLPLIFNVNNIVLQSGSSGLLEIGSEKYYCGDGLSMGFISRK